MTITIGGKEYTLYFGMDFIDTLNHLYGFESEGIKLDMGGLQMLQSAMAIKDVIALRNIIKAATATLKSKPSNKDTDAYIMDRIIEEGIDTVYKEFSAEIKKQPFLNALMKSK